MVCIALRVGDCDDGVKQAIASKIIEFAEAGERNPHILCEQVLKDIRSAAAEHLGRRGTRSVGKAPAGAPTSGNKPADWQSPLRGVPAITATAALMRQQRTICGIDGRAIRNARAPPTLMAHTCMLLEPFLCLNLPLGTRRAEQASPAWAG